VKKKREIPSRQDNFLKYFLMLTFSGIIIASLGICIFVSIVPQYFVISWELIPTAQYLQEYSEDNVFQLVVLQEYQHDKSLYDICIDMGYGALNYGDNRRTGFIIIDGQIPLRTGEMTRSLSVFYCARGVYLEKGLHLIEYKSQEVLFNQKWSIEIE